MKTKVNKQWYNQTVRELKNGIAKEKMQLRRQFYRYRDAKNGQKQAFDIENNISTEKLFQYLDDAIHQVGHAEVALKKITNNYEPDESVKVDWKGIEKEIKNWCEKNNGIFCEDDTEYLGFIGDFFCEPKFAVPDTEKNNDRVYRLMNKYFQS
jgi:hypothetical protein